ncbi:MAG: aspartate dehydrogenase domain-containing protein [Faecalibacterium sp.]
MKIKFGILGCGFLGSIVARAWKNRLLEDYELVGVASRSQQSAERLAAEVGCRACADWEELLALHPEYVVETASVEAVRAIACPVLRRSVNLVVISIGAFADQSFYQQVQQAARAGGAKVHLASGAIGGFDVLQTVTLMAQAQQLDETAGIETHTGARGFRNTPVWAEHLLTDTEKTMVFNGNARQAIETFPRRVNVAVAASLATTGPEFTGVTMHSVPGWVGDDHRITAEIEGVRAVVDICSSTSAIAGWSVVALLRNLSSPICFY